MSNFKIHTPEGFSDFCEDKYFAKSVIENRIMSVMKSFAYKQIETPMVEYYDVFSGDKEVIGEETMIKFFDRNGKILTLRPDLTTPVARMIATKYSDFKNPVRVCYLGKAFRFDEVYHGVLQREFLQAGIELIAKSGPFADAEVIAVTIEAILATGISEFQIDIGQVAFFKALMKEAKINNQDAEKIRGFIDAKDSLSIEELVLNAKINADLKEVIISLPTYFGEAEILDTLIKKNIGDDAKAALSELKTIYDILCKYGYEKYIAIDLGMVSNINYYTGIIFKGFTYGVGFPICAGGRYDNLLAKFGKKLPAVGVAIGIERLMAAINEADMPRDNVDILILGKEDVQITAYRLATELRCQGMSVMQSEGEWSEKAAKAYGKKLGAEAVFCLESSNDITIYDLIEGNTQKMKISDFIEED